MPVYPADQLLLKHLLKHLTNARMVAEYGGVKKIVEKKLATKKGKNYLDASIAFWNGLGVSLQSFLLFSTDVPTPWDIFFAVSPFSVLAYVVLSISS